MYAITDSGLRPLRGSKLVLVPGIEYPMGASSSPSTVLVTSVKADGTFTFRDYPYQGTDRYVGKSSAAIYLDLIEIGCQTERAHMQQVVKRGVMDTGLVPDWCREKLAFLESVLSDGVPTAPEGGAAAVIDGYKGVRLDLKVAPGTPPEAFVNDRGDPWYAAEDYGGVASSGDGADTIYHVQGKLAAARRAKADPRFIVVQCVSDDANRAPVAL